MENSFLPSLTTPCLPGRRIKPGFVWLFFVLLQDPGCGTCHKEGTVNAAENENRPPRKGVSGCKCSNSIVPFLLKPPSGLAHPWCRQSWMRCHPRPKPCPPGPGRSLPHLSLHCREPKPPLPPSAEVAETFHAMPALTYHGFIHCIQLRPSWAIQYTYTWIISLIIFLRETG